MKNIITTLLFFMLTLCSCEETELPQPQSTLVVEGWIENGYPPIVILTRPVIITSDYQNYEDLYDYVVRWAKVSVVCDNDTVVLTGKYDPDYTPSYIYTTGRMFGEVGKTYKLIVEYDSHRATAETTILPPPNITSSRLQRVEAYNALYQIEITLEDISPERNYYQCFYKVGRDTQQFFTTYLGTFDDDAFNYTQPIKILKGNNILTDPENATIYFLPYEYVTVKVSHIDQGAYHFWDIYSQNVELSYNMFLNNTTSIPTNITGGSGYWCGMGSRRVNMITYDFDLET